VTATPDRARRPTRTARFGTSKRESHDASDFYARFPAPTILTDQTVVDVGAARDTVVLGDSRNLSAIPDDSVALVVTSPPYFAGKEYEAALGEGHVPASYVEYLAMLRAVFAECWRVLEPGGRIAVNVANLGRKPYRSLAGDVVTLLQDDLGYLLRGEVVWIKGAGLNSSCAWGSYASASNPVLRDVTERIVVASKGRFGRALTKAHRQAQGLPFEDTITPEEFRELTLDTWRFAPESARRVGHPAPFPVELPRRCIELFTFRGDTVLDPFAGVGTVAVAALRTGRHFVCVDADPGYVETARERIAATRAELATAAAGPDEA
jgi:site-specific DNA-methyltransferase (adenine-specific)